MKLRQYDLKSGLKVMTTWLEDGRVKEGNSITLKGDEFTHWEVVKAYDTVIDHDQIKIGWNNNI